MNRRILAATSAFLALALVGGLAAPAMAEDYAFAADLEGRLTDHGWALVGELNVAGDHVPVTGTIDLKSTKDGAEGKIRLQAEGNTSLTFKFEMSCGQWCYGAWTVNGECLGQRAVGSGEILVFVVFDGEWQLVAYLGGTLSY